jgi:hypothetical protein
LRTATSFTSDFASGFVADQFIIHSPKRAIKK